MSRCQGVMSGSAEPQAGLAVRPVFPGQGRISRRSRAPARPPGAANPSTRADEQIVGRGPRPPPGQQRLGQIRVGHGEDEPAIVRPRSADQGLGRADPAAVEPAQHRAERADELGVRRAELVEVPRRRHRQTCVARQLRRPDHRARLRGRDLQGDVELLVGRMRRHPQAVVQRGEAQRLQSSRAASAATVAGPRER